MQHRQYQYGGIDYRKALFLAAGVLVIIAAIVVAIIMLTDKTNASTGDGSIFITPQRIEQISDDVGEQVLDTLRKDILTKMVEKSVTEKLTKDRLKEALADDYPKPADADEESLREMIKAILEEYGIFGDDVFTDDQEAYIRLAVEQALQDLLANVSISQLMTDEEKTRLAQELQQKLGETLKSQVQGGSFTFTGEEIEKLKKALDLKSIKAPEKGVDYFTQTEIKTIQNQALKDAKQEITRQVGTLSSKIDLVKTSVGELTRQVAELKLLDKEKNADITKLQESVRRVNVSMEKIGSMTKELALAVTVSGNNLEKVTGGGSDIRSVQMSASDMTIAQFVDVLAGNDQVYTGAIQELNKLVKQMKEETDRQDAELEKSLKKLEGSLSENDKETESIKTQLAQSDKETEHIKEQLAQSDQETKDIKIRLEQSDRETKDIKTQLKQSDREIRKQIQNQSEEQKKQLDEEKKTRETTDVNMQTQIDDTNRLIGQKEDAGNVEGDTIFQKIGAVIKILSADGIDGLRSVLQNIGAETVGEGVNNLHTDLTDARARVRELEKEKWYTNITLLAEAASGDGGGYGYQESGYAYVYRIPLVSENDGIDLNADDTSVVVEFKNPGRLPSNAAFSISGSALLITFANKPTRNIEITSIHVFKENKKGESSYEK